MLNHPLRIYNCNLVFIYDSLNYKYDGKDNIPEIWQYYKLIARYNKVVLSRFTREDDKEFNTTHYFSILYQWKHYLYENLWFHCRIRLKL